MTAYGTVAAAVQAMKLGAADFLEKPVELDDLFAVVGSLRRRRAERRRRRRSGPTTASRRRFVAGPGCPPIVGQHRRLLAALRLLRRVAPTETTVLLLGESGTGKELFARALHALSPRRNGPFVAINCAAIPESLLENELFGHERGAFTGAHRREPGRFERARGGTLLLDEIGELPLPVQGKILRVLEERTYERVGSGEPQHADVRLVAATNRDLQAMVEAGEFRSDLYFRSASSRSSCRRCASGRATCRRSPATCSARLAERHGLDGAGADAGGGRAAGGAALAGQRAPARQRARARGDPAPGRPPRRRRASRRRSPAPSRASAGSSRKRSSAPTATSGAPPPSSASPTARCCAACGSTTSRAIPRYRRP